MFIWILMGAVFILSLVVQSSLKSKFAKYSKVPLSVPMAGRDIASAMLHQNGCGDVKVTSVSGQLTDYSRVREVRREIARMKTILREMELKSEGKA